VQALLFGDGGVLALGANCFNMAFILPMVGHAIYSAIKERVEGEKGELIGAAVGSYVAINCAALAAAVEFGIQPLLFTNAAGEALYCPYPLAVSIPAMMVGHLTIWGAAEVVFTCGILAFLHAVAPDFGLDKTAAAEGGKVSEKFEKVLNRFFTESEELNLKGKNVIVVVVSDAAGKQIRDFVISIRERFVQAGMVYVDDLIYIEENGSRAKDNTSIDNEALIIGGSLRTNWRTYDDRAVR
jgi:hypothetical protein